jgi:hypothetical protein
MDIWTAQYRYNDTGRLDITAKGEDPLGKIFAPSWPMVMGVKNRTLTREQYSIEYAEIMNIALSSRYHQEDVHRILSKYQEKLVLVCFCPAGSFCHRYLLANRLHDEGWGRYRGEL